VNSDKQLDKIRKLLNMAERAATDEEADAFNRRAEQLMADWGIEAAQLAATGRTSDNIELRVVDIDAPYGTAKSHLLSSVARPMRCQTVRHAHRRGGGYSCTVVGFRSDIERVELLYTSLMVQATSQLLRVRPPACGGESVKSFRRAWLYAYGQAVNDRLTTTERRATAGDHAAVATTSTAMSTALVLREREQRVEDAKRRAFPHLVTRSVSLTSTDGFGAGYRAGHNADLGKARVRGHGPRRLSR
jgi:uncharacterized protein DUF2786